MAAHSSALFDRLGSLHATAVPGSPLCSFAVLPGTRSDHRTFRKSRLSSSIADPSATDNALSLIMTRRQLKPRNNGGRGMTYEKLIQEMDANPKVFFWFFFPGVQHLDKPVENRLDMELTGIKTPPVEDFGPNLDGIRSVRAGTAISHRFRRALHLREAFARFFYLNGEGTRSGSARYGY